MELQGTIVTSLPNQSGTSASTGKPWLKREFVIHTLGPYGSPVKLEVWNDKGDILKTLKKGQQVTVQIDITGRENKGQYYNSIKALKIELSSDPAPAATAPPKKPYIKSEEPRAQPSYQEYEREYEDSSDSDSLPF